jgi:hypothetical protein
LTLVVWQSMQPHQQVMTAPMHGGAACVSGWQRHLPLHVPLRAKTPVQQVL